MKTLNIIIFSFLFCVITNAQVLISDETTQPANISSNAILELRTLSKSKGLLLPKVSLTSTTNSSPLPSHITGMLVYNTVTVNNNPPSTNVYPGIYYNDGITWSKMDANIPNIGDIKYSNTTTDHDGWYLLNGRATNTLPAIALTNANAISIGANIPNTEDTFLKGKTGAETAGSVIGNNSNTLLISNLPQLNYNVTTTTNGQHTHSYGDRGSGQILSIESGSVREIVDDVLASSATTSSNGDHTHPFTISLGGSNVPIDIRPQYLTTNIFIYLGK